MKAEFKIGDKVTFKPYEKPCKCVVTGIHIGMFGSPNPTHLNGEPDDRIFYVLSGEAVSHTTGLSIVESKLYENSQC